MFLRALFSTLLLDRRRTEILEDGEVVDNIKMLSMGPIIMETLGAIQALAQQADLLEKEIARLEGELGEIAT